MDFARFKRLGARRSSVRLAKAGTPPIAIEFGAGSLKLLQAGGEPGAFSLIAAASLETPEELVGNPAARLSFQLQSLGEFVRSANVRGRRVVCALPAAHTLVRHMQVAGGEGISIGDSVEHAYCTQLGMPLGSVLVRHTVVDAPGRTGGKTEVICVGVSRELVSRLMKAVKDAKLEPVGMHSEPIATVRAFEMINRREEDRQNACAYIDIGAHSTNVTIGHADAMVFTKCIDFGGLTLDTAISRHTGLSVSEARAQRLAGTHVARTPTRTPAHAHVGALDDAPGQGDVSMQDVAMQDHERRSNQPAPGLTRGVLDEADASATGMAEPLEILGDEIAMCLRYHASLFPDTPVRQAIFLGGESRQLGLCQQVARAIRLPSRVADPMSPVVRTGEEMVTGIDLSIPQPGWAVVLGLCLCPTDL